MKTKKMFIGLGAAAALGAAIVPMSSFAVSDSAEGTVNVALAVGATISMSLEGTTINPSVLTSESSTDKTTVATINSNSSTGYTLSAETSSSDGSLVGANSNTIAYVGSGYSEAPEGWALGVGGTLKDIAGKKISLYSKDSTATNDTVTVNYNFKTSVATAPDTYSTTLTYTAAVK